MPMPTLPSALTRISSLKVVPSVFETLPMAR